MMKCEDVSRLVSRAHDRPLGLRERMGLRVHLWLCGNCRRFERQLRLLRRGLARLAERSGRGDGAVALSAAARERIRRLLAGNRRGDD